MAQEGVQIVAGDSFLQQKYKKIGDGQASRKKQISDHPGGGPMSFPHNGKPYVLIELPISILVVLGKILH